MSVKEMREQIAQLENKFNVRVKPYVVFIRNFEENYKPQIRLSSCLEDGGRVPDNNKYAVRPPLCEENLYRRAYWEIYKERKDFESEVWKLSDNCLPLIVDYNQEKGWE